MNRSVSSTTAGADRGVVTDLGRDLGPLEQEQQRGRHEAHRGLVAGDEQQHDEAEELVVGELLAAVLGRDERGDQVVAGMRTAVVDQRVGVGEELVGGAAGGRQRLEVHRDLVGCGHREGPVAQPRRLAGSAGRAAR